jgi:hypothetical protein
MGLSKPGELPHRVSWKIPVLRPNQSPAALFVIE